MLYTYIWIRLCGRHEYDTLPRRRISKSIPDSRHRHQSLRSLLRGGLSRVGAHLHDRARESISGVIRYTEPGYLGRDALISYLVDTARTRADDAETAVQGIGGGRRPDKQKSSPVASDLGF